MKLDTIRASSRTTNLFGILKRTTGIGPEAWARTSLCLSLTQMGIPNPGEYNTDGSEFTPSRLFPSDQNEYLALVLPRLKQDGLDPQTYLNEMVRAHINRGAISLKQRIDELFDVLKFMREMNVSQPQTRQHAPVSDPAQHDNHSSDIKMVQKP